MKRDGESTFAPPPPLPPPLLHPRARGEAFNEQQRRKGYLSNVTFWCPFPPILQKKIDDASFF